MAVKVRPWQPGDEDGAREVLREGSFSNVWPSFCIAIRRPWILTLWFLLLPTCWVIGVGLLAGMFCLASLPLIVYLACFVGTAYFFYGPNFNDLKRIQASYFSSPETHLWIAQAEGGEIVGTIAVTQKQTVDTDSGYETGYCDEQQKLHSTSTVKRASMTASRQKSKVAWLRRMAVKKSYRGQGIARQLLHTAISFCRQQDYDSIYLITTEVHQAARTLYCSEGFQQISYRASRHGGIVTVWMYEFELRLKGE